MKTKDSKNKLSEFDSRREFLIKSAKGLGIFVASITLLTKCENFIEKAGSYSGITIELDTNQDEYKILKRIGFGLMTTFSKVNYGIPVIIVKISNDKYACFSSMCTHAHCYGKDVRPSLGTSPGFKDIVCSCHGSRFDPFDNGKVLEGPAERPLKQYPTSFDSTTNILKITF